MTNNIPTDSKEFKFHVFKEEENEKLESLEKCYTNKSIAWRELREKLEIATKALVFYSDQAAYQEYFAHDAPILQDEGKTASLALNQLQKKNES